MKQTLWSPFTPEETEVWRDELTQYHKASKEWLQFSSLWPKAWPHNHCSDTLSELCTSVPPTSAQPLLVVKCLEHNEHSTHFVKYELNNIHELLVIFISFAHFTQIPRHFRLESFKLKDCNSHMMLLLAQSIQHLVNLTTCLHWSTIDAPQFLFLKNI